MGSECPNCGSQDVIQTVSWQDDICAECGASRGSREE